MRAHLKDPIVWQRALLVVVALVATGWLFAWLGDQRALTRTLAVSTMFKASRSEHERGLRHAERAGRTPPHHTAADVERAKLLSGLGRHDEAARLLDDIVRREPENITAWQLIRQASAGRDPARAAEADRRLAQLDPVRSRP